MAAHRQASVHAHPAPGTNAIAQVTANRPGPYGTPACQQRSLRRPNFPDSRENADNTPVITATTNALSTRAAQPTAPKTAPILPASFTSPAPSALGLSQCTTKCAAPKASAPSP